MRLRGVSGAPPWGPAAPARADRGPRGLAIDGRRAWRESEGDEPWSGVPFRAIAGDDLLRFFTVFQTVGMLG
jgi:hypothetical protein